MKRVILFLAIFFAIGFTPAPADIIQIPGDYPTIQEGIDAANEGDTLLVQPGEYVENIDYIGKNIVVASLYLTTGNPEFITSTIIDGDSSGSVVTFEGGEDTTAVITGFTIRNGYAEEGAGIYCANSSPTIRRNIICDNSTHPGSGPAGGGIYITYSNARVLENIFERNRACYGGGMCLLEAMPEISMNIFRHNIADP